ncbi:hypothetical protein [Methylobacterium sp. E-046]|uniref:hypothetical protein n=1 Tax=Methylobacterium sp. E-046 TaxID=2836576 RepID=UPI001FBA54E9|nr:hypothetical protein [Methylobacterium sp. E-046]MCJ2098922.1 hypothetical protein [Methylobacterium sp. E-046]
MTLKSWLALLLPAALRSDVHSELTRAVAENVHASLRRRRVSVQATMAADHRASAMEATIHRIEGRSGDRLTDHPQVGDAAYRVAEATRQFLRKSR